MLTRLPSYFLLCLTSGLLFSAESALADCNPSMPVDDDTVVCDDTDSDGYDASGATGLTITTDGTTVLTDADGMLDSAILISDDNTVTIGVDATIDVTNANSFGIQGIDDNTIINQGTINVLMDGSYGIGTNNNNFLDNQNMIVVDGSNSRGISVNQNTIGILPNGVENSGTIIVGGNQSFAIEGGDNSAITAVAGSVITLTGNNTRGISSGNRTDPSLQSSIVNFGLIEVMGTDSYGIKAGDGWVDGVIVGVPRTNSVGVITANSSVINVTGDNSYGIFVGDETSMTNAKNSLVDVRGTITATGIDAIAVSVGGNDLLDPYVVGAGIPELASLTNLGTITGGQDAGPLIEFRNVVVGRENSLVNDSSRLIRADMTLEGPGMPNRGIAIRGTSGAELIINLGAIEGIIELLDGNDRYIHFAGATLTEELRGGTGDDRVVLIGQTNATDTFDASLLDSIEILEISSGSTDWVLTGTSAFTDLIEITAGGRMSVPTSLTLGGGFRVGSQGTLLVTLDNALAGSSLLTVTGSSTFDGTITPVLGAGVAPGPTQFRVIQTNGGYTGRFQNSLTIGTDLFIATYDAQGLILQYAGIGLVAVSQTPNQAAVAQHLQDILLAGGADLEIQNFVEAFNTSTGVLANVYQALNPEIYDAQTTILVEGSRRISNLLFDRPRECQAGEFAPWQEANTQLPCHANRWSPWLATLGSFRSRDEFDGHPEYDSEIGGLIFGIDVQPVEDLDLTFAISSQRGSISDSGSGQSTVTLTDLSAHAAWSRGPLRVQGVFGWGHGFHKDRRQIQFNEPGLTPISARGVAEHDSDRISIAAEVGYVFDVGPWKVEPIGSLDWTWVYQRPIHEEEAGGFGIRIASRDDNIGSISGGVRVSTAYEHSAYWGQYLLWMDGTWRPSIDIRWRQTVAGAERDIEARLQGSPTSVAPFTLKAEEDAGGAEIGIGLRFNPKNANRLQFDFRYEAFVAENTVQHDLTARAVVSF